MTGGIALKNPSQVGNVPQYDMVIGGEATPSSSRHYYDIINPATEEVIAQVAEGTAEDIDRAVKAAWEGFERLTHMSARERGRLLYDLSRSLEQHFDEFAELECLNQGKPIRHVRGFDIPNSIETIEFFAGAATKLRGSTVATDPQMFNYVRREPFGVVGQIIPWNYPLMMACWKIAPAIAAGNAVVIIPAPNTPLTLLKLAQLAKDVGFPDGILNVVTGQGPVVGDALTKHSGVRKIGFTGSTVTGRAVSQNASIHHAPTTLELGGKSANIFFEDVELGASLKKAVLGCFHNAGQMCLAGSRLLVHESIYDQFVKQMSAYAAQMKVGDPRDKKTQVGPVVSKRQLDRVLGYIEEGKRSGATLTVGGGRVPTDRGFFVQPTIFSDVDPASRIAQEEIFGPVACIIKFKTEEEAISIANNSAYGLAAGVHTNNLARAHRVAAALQAGTVWINTFAFLTPAAPVGGYKQSGHGRELGLEGIESYTQLKTIFISPNEG
jgi:acyl-CoA reductase-like NAD-dependent aldehyde dehydrogenase